MSHGASRVMGSASLRLPSKKWIGNYFGDFRNGYSLGNFLARKVKARSRVWRFCQKSDQRSPTFAMRSSKLRKVNCSAEMLVESSSGERGVETVALGKARTEYAQASGLPLAFCRASIRMRPLGRLLTVRSNVVSFGFSEATRRPTTSANVRVCS